MKAETSRNTNFRKWTIGALPAVLLLAVYLSGQSMGIERTEFDVVRVTFGTSSHEISGTALVDGRLYAVADGRDDLRVYAVREMGNRFELEAGRDFAALSDWRNYRASLERDARLSSKDRLIDFEGLGACSGDLYIANERARHILRVRYPVVERLPIDFSGFKDLQEGGGNAGFEGVAIDCASGLMYVAKERSPRAIFTVRMKDWRVVAVHDLEPSAASARNRAGMAQDFSDLTFDGGHLYVLERSARQIAKVEPSGMRVVARVSFARAERGLYDVDPRFGLAEGLSLSSNEVILSLDNNGARLSGAAQEQFGVSGTPPTIIHLRRPRGF